MRTKTALVIAALVVAPGADALAQACIGVPVGSGGFAVAGHVGFPEDATSVGVTGTANLTGPLSVQAGYERTTFDETDGIEIEDAFNTLHGGVAFELPVPMPTLSVCPIAGIGYTTFSTEIETFELGVDALSVPVGVGVGTTIPAGVAALTLYAIPQLIYTRAEFEFSGFGETESETDDSTDFATEAGVLLGVGRFWGGLTASKIFADDEEDEDFSLSSDAVLEIRLGVRLGGL